MNELDTSTPLDIHTLTSLCDELTSGRPLRIGTDGERFELSENSSRSIFQWYRQNRSKWRGNVRRDDVLAIAERIRYLPVEVPRIEEESSKTGNRLLHVRHVTAHSFGGIQRSGNLARRKILKLNLMRLLRCSTEATVLGKPLS